MSLRLVIVQEEGNKEQRGVGMDYLRERECPSLRPAEQFSSLSLVKNITFVNFELNLILSSQIMNFSIPCKITLM